MHESSKHFCFVCSLMPKLYRTNWLADIVSTVTLRNISCVIRSKIHFVKYCYVTFYARVIFAAGAGVRKGANFLHSCATIRHEIASFSRSRRQARRMSALREIAVAEFVWFGPRRRPIPIAVTVPYWFSRYPRNTVTRTNSGVSRCWRHDPQPSVVQEEAWLLQRDRATLRVSWRLVNCDTVVRKNYI